MPLDRDGPEVIEPRVKAERSLTTLLSDVAGETVELVRQELALFKAELQEKLGRAGIGAALVGAGALIAYSGWLFLLLAAVFALALVLPAWAAALIVGVLVLGHRRRARARRQEPDARRRDGARADDAIAARGRGLDQGAVSMTASITGT